MSSIQTIKDLNMVKKTVSMFKWVLFFLSPYITVMADRLAYMNRGYYSFGGEMFVPIFCWIGVILLHDIQTKLSKKINKLKKVEAISEKVNQNVQG